MMKLTEMPDNTRVWIYQADRFLTPSEIRSVKDQTCAFLGEWTSHGQNMEAGFEVIHDRFLVIGADETQAMASGCGIDKSVRFVQELGQTVGIDFFKRTQVLYMQEEKIHEAALNNFWAMRKAGLISDETLVFDNTAKNTGELKTKWLVPFSRSWHQEMWGR